MGPSRCCLCLSLLDSVDHLFGECFIFQDVWLKLSKSLQFIFKWDKCKLEENIYSWKISHPLLIDVPYATPWEV